MVWITFYIFLMFWNLELILSERLCSCTNDISVPIYTKPTGMSELLAELSSQDCVSILHNNNNEWSKVLHREKVGYMLTSDLEKYLCHGDEHIKVARRFLGDFYRCLADHCMRCHCEKHEASCGDCGSTCTLDYSALCTKWKVRVDGHWSIWSSWSNCSASVCNDAGVQTRMRDCNNPPKTQFGKDCVGDKSQTINCTTQCKVDGHWSEWSSYGPCNATCGDGTKIRTRSCTNPSPKYGGSNCTGDTEQRDTCSTGVQCVVDGGYSDWTTWTECVADCGGNGLSYRHRSCDNPKPQGGGKPCKGIKFGYRPCVKTCTSPPPTTKTTTTTTPPPTTTPSTQPPPTTTPSTQPPPMTTPSTQPPPTTSTSTQPPPTTKPSTQPQPTTTPSTQPPPTTTSSTQPPPTTTPTTQPPPKTPKPTTPARTTPQPTTTSQQATTTPTPQTTSTPPPTTTPVTTQPTTPLVTTDMPTTRNPSTEPTTELQTTGILSTSALPALVTLYHCDKIKLTDDIVKGTKISSANAAPCPESGLHISPEAAVIENCNISTPDTWTKGMSVVELCKIGVPKSYFPPISSFIGKDYDRVHDLSGVLLECTNSGIKMALQVCGHPVGIFPVYNNTFVPTLNLNNYYVIN